MRVSERRLVDRVVVSSSVCLPIWNVWEPQALVALTGCT